MINYIFLVLLFIIKIRYPRGKSVIDVLRGKYGNSYVKLYRNTFIIFHFQMLGSIRILIFLVLIFYSCDALLNVGKKVFLILKKLD